MWSAYCCGPKSTSWRRAPLYGPVRFKLIFRHLLSKTTNREFCIHFHGLLFNNAFPNDTWCHLNFDLIKLLVEICPTILISDLYSNKSSENQTVLVCSLCNMQYLCSISLVKFEVRIRSDGGHFMCQKLITQIPVGRFSTSVSILDIPIQKQSWWLPGSRNK